MATSILINLTTILSLLIPLLTLALYTQVTLSSIDIEDDEEYVPDAPPPDFRSRSRFLVSVIKKGRHCNPTRYNICNGVSANNGTSLLYCCKTHCRNVLGDKNNCGRCGHKCKFGEFCCHGTCVNVADNPNHCGKCHIQCASGLKCEYGSCGYA